MVSVLGVLGASNFAVRPLNRNTFLRGESVLMGRPYYAYDFAPTVGRWWPNVKGLRRWEFLSVVWSRQLLWYILIFFFKLFWIHRCNLFVFIVCAPWVLFEDCAPYKNPPLLLLLLWHTLRITIFSGPYWWRKSSCECKKVVSDILDEIEFFIILRELEKRHILSHNADINSKYLHFLWKK